MDISKHTTSSNLERYAFYWLLALLVISAGALFLDARPPITLITGYSSTVWSLLDLSWIVSGAAAVYLTYQWVQNKKQIFGGNNTTDMGAFCFMLLSGFNIGILGIFGINIYFGVAMGLIIYIITGVISLAVAGYLYKRWQETGESLFGVAAVSSETSEQPPVEATTPTEPGN